MSSLYKRNIHFYVSKFFLLAALITITACQHNSATTIKPLPVQFNGIWQSNGYGYLIDASGGKFLGYNLTPDICLYDPVVVEAFEAYANNQIVGGKLVATQDGKQLYFSEPFEDYRLHLNRVEELPVQCQTPPKNTQIDNFDTFASYMQTHYAFFKLYGVNWLDVVAQNRIKITKDISDKDLFNIFSDMLAPLKDAHLSLKGYVDDELITYRPEQSLVGNATAIIAEKLNTSKSKIDRKLFERYWFDDIKTDILNRQGEMDANDLIQYGITSDDIGYMAMSSTYNYANKGLYNSAEDQAILSTTLDKAITLFNQQKAKAVIIDLSINFGGHSFPATDIAARFTDKKILAFSKRAHDAKALSASPIYIVPTHKPSYLGAVYMLAANVTVSGGEEVVLALRSLPNVTFFGERTRGALSDILEKPLPNGWVLALSNEIYTDHNGIEWEGDGIKPDRELTVFDRKNPFEGHLEAVEFVIKYIDQESQ